MTLNIDLLSRLVTWAAEDNMRHTDPDRAVSLGILKEEHKAKFVKKWDQNVWASAERNGVCETAFCIAGHAVDKDENLVQSMVLNYKADDIRHYGAGRVIEKSKIPAILPEGAEMEFGMLWLDEDPDEIWSEMLGSFDAFFAETREVREAARETLGLTLKQSGTMFDGDNEIEAVVGIAYGIAEGQGVALNIPVWVTDAYGADIGEYDENGYRHDND